MLSLFGGGIGVGAGKGVGAGGGGIKGLSLFGGGVGVGAGGGGIKVLSLFGGGVGVGAEFVLGMGAHTGSLIGLGNGTFEVTGEGLVNQGVGMIMVEVGGMVCISTEGALRR